MFAGLITGTLLFLVSYSPIAIGLISGIFLVLTIIAGVRDTLKKTTVLLYNLDGDAMLAFGKLTSAFDRAAGSEKIWHVQSQAAVLDRKYHAGAAAEVKTDDAHLAKAAPSKVKTNVQPLTIPLPGRKLYLLPDRLLVSDAVGLGQSITSGSK